jgi:undecaprenyl-diphosphatase
MRRLIPREAALLLAVLAIVAGTWAFIEVTEAVVEGDTRAFDEWAVQALRRSDDPSVPIGPPWLQEAGRDFTALGGVAVLTVMTLAVAGYLLLRRAYGSVVLLLAATVGGAALSTALKAVIGRPRPGIVPQLSIVASPSFPSGHSMLSAVVYLTLGTLLARLEPTWRRKAYFLGMALFLSFLVGVSRIYLGVHYPTDVLAGWSAGLVWAMVCWVVARALQRRGTVETGPHPGPHHPPDRREDGEDPPAG